jgi:predicted TIM-barrel fold metal-dependent hydrolase
MTADNRIDRRSRREFLTGLTALGATALIPAGRVWAQASSAAATRPYRIDTHHQHNFPNGSRTDWTKQSLEFMERHSIAAAIISKPTVPVDDLEKARKAARAGNDIGAEVVRDHPDRYGLFATLPLINVDASLREIEYAVDVLKADGFVLMTSYAGKWPGDPSFAPVFDELNRRKAVVFVHPTTPACCADLGVGMKGAALEFMFDSTRAIVSVIIGGTLLRCPDVRFIFAHGGGTLPYLHDRMRDLISEEHPATVPNGFLHEMQKLYFDVVRVANPETFPFLMKLMPPERLLFGTDFPALPVSNTVADLKALGLDAKVVRVIERDNALRLFPRFKT